MEDPKMAKQTARRIRGTRTAATGTKGTGGADILALIAQNRAAARAAKSDAGSDDSTYKKPMLPGNDPVQILDGLFTVELHVPFEYQDADGRAVKGKDAWKDERTCGGEYRRLDDGTLDFAGVNVKPGPAYDRAEMGTFPSRLYVPLGAVRLGLFHESVGTAAEAVLARVLTADKGAGK